MKGTNDNVKPKCAICKKPVGGKPYVLKGKTFHSKECAENYKCMGRHSSHGHDCCG